MANKKNLAVVELNAGISATDTTAVAKTGQGARLPATPFFATLTPPGVLSTPDNSEIISVTAVSTDTLTIVRAQKGTTAYSFVANSILANGIYKEDFDDYQLLDSELTAIAGLTSAADKIPYFTGSGTAGLLTRDTTTTLAANSDSNIATQKAVKAYVDAAITAVKSALYPVGSYYINETDSTNPGTLLGFGTWTAVAGRTIVGKAASGTFATAGSTGGTETETLTTAQIPAHSHTDSGHTHQENLYNSGNEAGGYGLTGTSGFANRVMVTASGGQSTVSSSANIQNTGGGGSHNNLPPYIVAYVWKRTA